MMNFTLSFIYHNLNKFPKFACAQHCILITPLFLMGLRVSCDCGRFSTAVSCHPIPRTLLTPNKPGIYSSSVWWENDVVHFCNLSCQNDGWPYRFKLYYFKIEAYSKHSMTQNSEKSVLSYSTILVYVTWTCASEGLVIVWLLDRVWWQTVWLLHVTHCNLSTSNTCWGVIWHSLSISPSIQASWRVRGETQ